MKKKQKIKTKDQLQFFSRTIPRNASEKIVVRSLSSKPAALLPMYAVTKKINI
jgi:hypothetical protein